MDLCSKNLEYVDQLVACFGTCASNSQATLQCITSMMCPVSFLIGTLAMMQCKYL